MRKAVLALAGAAALVAGSAASATVSVSSPTGVLSAAPSSTESLVVTNGGPGFATVTFGNTNLPLNTTFSGGFDITNTLDGLYNLTLNTSTTGVSFSSAVLNGLGFTEVTAGDPQHWALNNVSLGAGTYGFSFTGHNSNNVEGGLSALSGDITITPALPEPGTWAMMLLGFGAIGLSLRSRRKPVLAQVA